MANDKRPTAGVYPAAQIEAKLMFSSAETVKFIATRVPSYMIGRKLQTLKHK